MRSPGTTETTRSTSKKRVTVREAVTTYLLNVECHALFSLFTSSRPASLFQLGNTTCHLIQLGKARGTPEPSPQGLNRRTGRIVPWLSDRASNPALPSNMHVISNSKMPRHARLPGNHAACTNFSTAGNTHLRRNRSLAANSHPMPDLH